MRYQSYHPMPMQFSDRTLLQMLLCRRNVCADWQICDYLLSHPAAG